MRERFLLIMVLFIGLSACHSNKPRDTVPGAGNRYALGFRTSSGNGVTRLSVLNPWEKASGVEINYYLIDRNSKVPDSLSEQNVIRIPVKKIICLSTSHLAFLDEIRELDKVTGISGAPYVSNAYIRERVEKGVIRDVGYGQNLNYEEIISQKPDMVMVYGVDSEIAGFLGKFRDLGIPAVINAEYLESTPLGKAEWIKFTGAFFNKSELADSLFRETEQRYNELVHRASHATSRPGVMVGLPYRDAWWVPGGNSYMAQLIRDAGGKYVAGHNPSHESFVISMEDAINLSAQATVWINNGMVTEKSEILTSDSRFANFPLFSKGRIFNNNKRMTEGGGMDFWESGTTHPDLVLKDLIQIFHPGLLPADSLTYYQEIR